MDDIESTAVHEAGHAVAAFARGGRVDSVTIKATDEHVGLTQITLEDSSHRSFAIYAGLWAETRAQWPFVNLEGEHYGRSFEDCIELAWRRNPYGDGELYAEQLRIEESEGGLFVREAREREWNDELERLWPAIQLIAALLISEETVTHADISAAFRGASNEGE